jgi:predicted glycosyltransferase
MSCATRPAKFVKPSLVALLRYSSKKIGPGRVRQALLLSGPALQVRVSQTLLAWLHSSLQIRISRYSLSVEPLLKEERNIIWKLGQGVQM